jgi:hypothetical protein
MRIKILILFITVIHFSKAENITSNTETWFQTFVNARLSSTLGVNFDAGFRTRDQFINRHFQTLFRIGAVYYFEKTNLTIGYAHFITEGNPEHRAYQFFVVPQNLGIFNLRHRYRLEQRFRYQTATDKYIFNHRFGYQLQIQIPLKGKKIEPKTPFILIQDEIFINFGKNVRNNFFDQNRILLGFGYQFSKTFTANIGYQYNFVQRANPETFEQINGIRLNAIINLDFRNDTPKP